MLKHASVIISFALAIFYALGLTQYQGYLSELGLQEAQFPLPPDRIFFQGFFVLAQMNAETMNYQAIAAAACAALAVLLFTFGGFLPSVNPKKLSPKAIIDSAEPKKHHRAADFLMRVASNIIWAFLIFIAIVVVLMTSEASGREYAESFRDKSLSGHKDLKELKLRKGSACLYGFTVVCNASQCAYLIDNHSTIISHNEIEWAQSLGEHKVSVDNADDQSLESGPKRPPGDCKLKSHSYYVPT